MSDVTALIGTTIDKVLERVDGLASKLGIAATEVWAFTVKAKLTEARREIARGVALLFLPIVLAAWSGHVAMKHLPHETHIEVTQVIEIKPCDQMGVMDGKPTVLHEQCTLPRNENRVVEGDLTATGGVLAASGVITILFACLWLCIAGDKIIGGVADLRMAEYNAYQDILSDVKD